MLDYWGNGIALLAYCALHACNFIYIQVYIYIPGARTGKRRSKHQAGAAFFVLFSFLLLFFCMLLRFAFVFRFFVFVCA